MFSAEITVITLRAMTVEGPFCLQSYRRRAAAYPPDSFWWQRDQSWAMTSRASPIMCSLPYPRKSRVNSDESYRRDLSKFIFITAALMLSAGVVLLSRQIFSARPIVEPRRRRPSVRTARRVTNQSAASVRAKAICFDLSNTAAGTIAAGPLQYIRLRLSRATNDTRFDWACRMRVLAPSSEKCP